MPVTALLALPAVLPSTRSTLDAAVHAALGTIGAVDRVVVLGAGPEPLVHDPATAHRRPGSDTVPISVDRALLAAIADRGQAPRVPAERLEGDLGRLVAEVSVATGLPCVPMSVAAGADPAALQVVAAGLRAATRRTGGRTAVVAQADLATAASGIGSDGPAGSDGSPGMDGPAGTDGSTAADEPASAFDAAVVAALVAGTPEVLLRLGPDRAASVGASGWAPLCVLALAAAAEGHQLQVTANEVVDGRSHLVVVAG